MGVLDESKIKAASVVSAAMQQKGAVIQAEMLDMVTGDDGKMLAGLLFLIAIAGGIITIAIGGRYLWARYLLVGPALFLFLTQVQTNYAGTSWQVGIAKLPEETRQLALRNVVEGVGGNEGVQVSLFFQFWNVLTSDLASTTLGQLNLTDDGSHLNFISKVERYMNFWDQSYISDPDILGFIQIAMKPKCADYYMYLKMMADPHVSDPQKEFYRPWLEERGKVNVFAYEQTPRDQNHLFKFLEDNGIPPGTSYTCQELWEEAVGLVKAHVEENILSELSRQPAPGQEADWIKNAFYKKILTETTRAASMTKFDALVDRDGDGNLENELAELAETDEFSQGLLLAVDWVVARSLFKAMWEGDKFRDSFQHEGHGGARVTGVGPMPGQSDQIATTSNAIQQFNRTEKYQLKGDYVNAALSLPHFQGVLLLLLSASYPFFAMAVILPGRASAIFTWMGLWAWLKLWDVGFGVVMMIDNILYALFPRGSNLQPGDLDDAGKTWVRIMEVDPNYSQTTYYNLIATCLYAVPLVTAVFVKGGGRELVNASHSRWMKYSERLAGSAVTFARSLQSQSYAGRMQLEKTERGIQAARDAVNGQKFKDLDQQMKSLNAAMGALGASSPDAALKNLEGMKGGKELAAMVRSGKAGLLGDLKEKNEMAMRQQQSLIDVAASQAMYDYTDSTAGYWASESAVAARFFSHDLADEYPERQQTNAYLNTKSYNKSGPVEAMGNEAKNSAVKAIGGTITPGGKR